MEGLFDNLCKIESVVIHREIETGRVTVVVQLPKTIPGMEQSTTFRFVVSDERIKEVMQSWAELAASSADEDLVSGLRNMMPKGYA